MAKPGIIAAGVASVLAVGTAGYFANEWRVCRSLKADYLAFAQGSLADQQLKNAVDRPEFDRFIAEKTDTAVMEAGQTLFDLETRCGKRAAVDAQVEALELILGT
ncbi:hypothetical protein [Erythrobacter sp. WG]|uniref:hypothetical protein n=1 Tax=Erythrobacter sp. WG TaxID=2985510 RepID=UPI0022712425|nr:hypothetical protein [Erythrobacter sp. WG]MCX9146576.1 hypothetical protein [Erythrobacter sp. WG]